MLSNNQQKFIASLQVKKYRQKYRKFTVEGEKMVGELLRQQRVGVDSIFCLDGWAAENEPLLRPFFEKTQRVTDRELAKISALQTPNQVLAVADMPDEAPDFQRLASEFFFFLDGLQDPGNLGAILRVADWFGFGGVFCSPETVDVFNPKVIQSGMGAFLRVPVWELPLDEILENAPASTPVLGAVMDGDDVFKIKKPTHGLLVIGNEGRGISEPVLAKITQRLTIPRSKNGGAESLNAAVAAGILAGVLRN